MSARRVAISLLLWLALLASCATPELSPPKRASLPRPGSLAVLISSPDNGLIIESLDGHVVRTRTDRIELLPGKHTLKLHSEVGAGSRFAETGSIELTFVAEPGRTYWLRGSGDVAQGRWTARIEVADIEGAEGRTAAFTSELEVSCYQGVAASCLRLGAIYEQGDISATWKQSRAAFMYGRACAGGEPLGCNNLGKLHQSGVGVARDERQAADFFERACSGGENRGCRNLADQYQKGRGVRRDERRAAALYERACGTGDSTACYELAGLYREGVGVEPDEARAAELYEKACAGTEPKGCTGLGLLHENGLGVEHDEGRAATLYERACAAGAVMGCANLGVMYQLGLGVNRDVRRAIELFTKACTGGVESACLGLAYLEPDRAR